MTQQIINNIFIAIIFLLIICELNAYRSIVKFYYDFVRTRSRALSQCGLMKSKSKILSNELDDHIGIRLRVKSAFVLILCVIIPALANRFTSREIYSLMNLISGFHVIVVIIEYPIYKLCTRDNIFRSIGRG